MTKPIRFPCNTGNTVQKGQYHTQEDLHQDQVKSKEASNHHEQAIEDHAINAQERLKEPPLSEPSLICKASHNNFHAGQETPIKSAKHVSEIPICPSQETTSASTFDSSSTALGLNRVQVALLTYYEPYLNIKRVSGDTLSLESCYINLAIVEAPDQRQKDKEDLKAQAAAFHRMPSYEEISKANMKAPIPLEKLFDKRKLRDGRADVPKTILVQGRAGIGKTTLCKKLVHAYQGGLWRDRFDAVLWLPLRQLKGLRARNIEDLLREKYFAQLPKQEMKALASLLAGHARNGKVLFILDGLDEIVLDAKSEYDIALEPFLKYLLQQDHVVITSRPSGVDTSILPKLDLELETVGFSMQNVKDYIHRVLNPDTAMAVQDYIEQTPLIQSLVNIPVQLDVVCYSWDSLPSNEQSITMTRLYQTMVRKLWGKDAVRLQKEAGKELTPQLIQRLLPYQIDQMMAIEDEYLSFLAFKGIRDHKIEFDESTLMEAMQELDELRKMANQGLLPFQLLDTLKQTSFLHTADAELDTGKDDSQRAWYFLHLTFQEYFAATWFARHLQIKQSSPKNSSAPMMTVEETKGYIQEHKYNPRYQIIWWMVAGILEGETLLSFFELLQEAPVDLIGGYHHHLLAACLKEGRSQLNNKIVENLEIQLKQWLQLEMTINVKSDGRSILGGMSYFPEELLIRSICQNSASQDYFIRTLGMRVSLTQPALKVLLNVIQDEDWKLRKTAVIALGRQSTLPESILQALIGALQDENWNVRKSAAEALGNQSTLPESILQTLIGALQHESWYVRYSATNALGKHLILPGTALQALISALQDENMNVRGSAAGVLGRQSTKQLTLPESILQAFIGALPHWSRCVGYSATNDLGDQLIFPESTLQALIGALQDKDDDVRKSAAEVLGKQSTLSESTHQALIGALQDENRNVRRSTVEALGNQSMLPESTLRALIVALQDEDEDVRYSATNALGKQSALPESTLQALIGALQDKDDNVRKSAAGALGKQLTLPESTLQTLIGALQDKNRDVRRSAAEVLGKQSTLPESTHQSLISALQDKDKYVMISAAEALGKKSTLPESTLQALIGALQHGNSDVRRSAANALGKQSTLPESTLQALIGAQQDKNWNVRRSAAEALENQMTLPESILKALVCALQDEDNDVRSFATKALGRQSTLPVSILQALIGALQDENSDVRRSAAKALGNQSTLPESTLQEALNGVLQDKDDDVRNSATQALGKLGKQSTLPELTLQALTGALQDKNWKVRGSAAEALGNQSILPESTLQALIGAMQDKDGDVSRSAAKALGNQSTLPVSTLQVLIDILQDKDEDFRISVAE
ncbi:hypothetical protein BGX26_003254, partial [Mortierella sp. AD094]